jgi:hypothetical protein
MFQFDAFQSMLQYRSSVLSFVPLLTQSLHSFTPPPAVASLAAKLLFFFVEQEGLLRCLPFAPLLSWVLHSSTPLRPCDKDEGGCGKLIPTTHMLGKAPRLFTIGTSPLAYHIETSCVDDVYMYILYVFLIEKTAGAWQEDCLSMLKKEIQLLDLTAWYI